MTSRVVINTLHPYYKNMVSESVNNLSLRKKQYVIDCIHDALAECLLIKKKPTIRIIKLTLIVLEKLRISF